MSDVSDEEFATYGTPLEPLEEDAIPKKRPMTVEDQVAKDKHGRRRFHGAFTGGFSAGFFNTVGSLEGWKPSQFASSRSSKAKAQLQRPEDFMDEEDMDEFGIAPKMLRPTGHYEHHSGESSRKRSLPHLPHGPIPGTPVLKTLIEPVKETIGIKLLMSMGWKPGQGVGPRLSRAEKLASRKQQKREKVYGCALPNQEDLSEAIEEVLEDEEDLDMEVLFAPDDYEPYIVNPKDNSFGLGYTGLDRRPVLSGASTRDLFGPSLVMEEKKKKVSIRGQAFGVGAFEEDDMDIYASEDMSQYDFALDTPQMLAEKRQQGRRAKAALPTLSADVLEGFVLSSHPVIRKRFPPPPLPQGFTSNHRVHQSRFSKSENTANLSAKDRAVLVNAETSQTNRLTEKPPTVEKIPGVASVSGTFKPFVADPEKQLRYEKFLSLGQSDQLRSLQPVTMTEWERERERVEFEQASRLYRPLSAAFSDRFVSASQPDDTTNPLAPVARTATADEDIRQAAKLKMFGHLTRKVCEWEPHNILCKRFNIPQPGRTTGSMKPKTSRPKFSVFNFLDAAPLNATVLMKEVTACSKSEDMVTSTSDITSEDVATSSTIVTPDTTHTADGDAAAADDDNIEQLVDSTHKMDLYKAIFLSSSDESDGEEEKSVPVAVKGQGKDQPSAIELNILRNTSPPRGIFANLDFDALNCKKTKNEIEAKDDALKNTPPLPEIFATVGENALDKECDKINSEVTLKCENHLNKSDQSFEPTPETSEVYGPSLPTTIPQQRHRAHQDNKDSSSESEEEWVEVNEQSDSDKPHRHPNKKKHSKKSHKKRKKNKAKHKKKKS